MKNYKSVLKVTFLLLFSLLLFACSSSSEDSAACSFDYDCKAGFRCNNNECVSNQCSNKNDCLANEYCQIEIGSSAGFCASLTDGDTDTESGENSESGGGSNLCIDGIYRCMGQNLEKCEFRNSSLDWRFNEFCEAGCQLGQCNDVVIDGDDDSEPEPVCTPGFKRCFDNHVQICDDMGMLWRVDDPCSAGTCVEESPDAWCGPKLECTPGMRACSEDGPAAVLVCKDDGTGWNKIWCSPSEECITALCQSQGVCNNGDYRCNGATVETCVGNNWSTLKNCQQGTTCVCGQYNGSSCKLADCIADVICTPLLDTRCSGTVRERCDATGKSWYSLSDCADDGQTCVNGSCQ